jgi:hypothetical protein
MKKPQTDEQDRWERQPGTQQAADALKKNFQQDAKEFLSACMKSTDPLVRHYVAELNTCDALLHFMGKDGFLDGLR